MAANQVILKEGWLKKRSLHLNIWQDKYFVIRGSQILYFTRKEDSLLEQEPKRQLVLMAGCKVTNIRSETIKKKKFYAFSVYWPEEADFEDTTDKMHRAEQQQPVLNTSIAESKKDSEVIIDSPQQKIKAGSASKSKLGPAESLDSSSFCLPSTQTPYPIAVQPPAPSSTLISKGSSPNDNHGLSTAAKIAALAVGGVVVGALTAGVGLVAGMVIIGMSAAAGGGAVAYQGMRVSKNTFLSVASESYKEIEEWSSCISLLIKKCERALRFPLFSWYSSRMDGMTGYDWSHSESPPPLATHLEEVEVWTRTTKWEVVDVRFGMRICQPIALVGKALQALSSAKTYVSVSSKPSFYQLTSSSFSQQSSLISIFMSLFGLGSLASTNQSSCRKISSVIPAPALQVFLEVMNPSPNLMSGVIRDLQVVERINDHADVIHMVCRPCYIYPSWTAPRDFCLVRYWHCDNNGTYVICLDSIAHQSCPLLTGHVRANLHAVYIISPKAEQESAWKNSSSSQWNAQPSDTNQDDDIGESLITFIVHVNPRGWLWPSLGQCSEFANFLLSHVPDLKETVEATRYLEVHIDAEEERSLSIKEMNDTLGKSAESSVSFDTICPSTCPLDLWTEADASIFKVRGHSYLVDKVKIQSEPSIFRLAALDIFEVSQPIYHIAAHPRNRMQLARHRKNHPFVFIIQIMLPGPPHYSFTCYAVAPKGSRQESFFQSCCMSNTTVPENPFERLALPFFFGSDDAFRDTHFKLIPKIAEGNMIVKIAVKETPAILGTKLKQHYFKGDGYFELDIDVASSSIAARITSLSVGYSKTLVIDMGMLLEGQAMDELPEVVMFGVRAIHMDLSYAPHLDQQI